MTSTTKLITAVLLAALPTAVAAQNPPTPSAAPTPAAAPAPAATPAPASTAPAIEKGSTVQLEYTLSEDGGAVLDTNKGKEPLTYTHGDEQIMPALEKQLAGMHAGEEKHVVLKPDEAYGPVNPTALTEVPKEMLPKDSLSVGSRLIARNAEGQMRPVTVKEVKESTVVLDLNHPLAGKTIVFDVKVLGVEPPKADGPKSDEPKKDAPKSTN